MKFWFSKATFLIERNVPLYIDSRLVDWTFVRVNKENNWSYFSFVVDTSVTVASIYYKLLNKWRVSIAHAVKKTHKVV